MLAVAWVSVTASPAAEAASEPNPSLEITKGANLTILHGGQRFGDLEPCSCPTNETGGVDREAQHVADYRKALGDILLVEAGGIMTPAGQEEYRAVALKFIYQALVAMGYDAINIGAWELRLGVEYVTHYVKESGAPAVSANVMAVDGKTPLFPKYRIIEKKLADGQTIKIGITGATASKYIPRPPDPNRMSNASKELMALRDQRDEPILKLDSILDRATRKMVPKTGKNPLNLPVEKAVVINYVQALESALAEMKPQCDLSVVLFDGGSFEAEYLAKVLDADVLLTNEARTPPAPPEQQPAVIEGTIVSYSGIYGRALGRMDLAVQKDTKPKMVAGYAITIGRNDPMLDSMTKLMHKYRSERRAIKSDYDPQVTKVNYVGHEICRRCHPDEHAHWSGTTHAEAYLRLVARGEDDDKDQLARVVTGMGELGGFTTFEKSNYLANVQCEVCHGPGHKHQVNQRLKAIQEKFPNMKMTVRPAPMKKDFTEQDCVTCHSKQDDPDFDFKAALEKVRHTKPEQPTVE